MVPSLALQDPGHCRFLDPVLGAAHWQLPHSPHVSDPVSLTLNSVLVIPQLTFTQLIGDSYDPETIRRNV